MRILPVSANYRTNYKNANNTTGFEKKQLHNKYNVRHNYTGVASVDLAYASMFDYSIARDLKLMGLI